MTALAQFLALLRRFLSQLSGQSVGPIDPPIPTPPTVVVSSITAGTVTLNLGNLLPGDQLDWGDGTTVTATSTLSRTYATSGTRTVTVLRGSVAVASIPVAVTVPPPPATVTVASIVNAAVTLTLGSLQPGDTLNWGDGVIVAAAPSLSHTYSTSGTRTVRVIRVGAADVTASVTVTVPPPAATISNSGDAFALSWPATPGASEYVVKRAYAPTGREFIPINTATLTATSYTDNTVYDGLSVWYQVWSVAAGVETLQANLNGTQPARVWTAATTLTSGTYTGLNVRNTSGNAVTLNTGATVTLIDCRIAATGHGVTGFGNRITGRNCRLWSLMPSGTGNLHGKAWNGEDMKLLDVQGSLMEGWWTTEGKNYTGTLPTDTYVMRQNIVRNVNGRRTDGAGGYQDYSSADGNDSSFAPGQAFLLNGVTGLVGGEIAWNWVHNEAGYSRVEDNINTFRSGGTSGSPLNIHHNLIMGAYPALPADARSTYYTGGGILSGDVNSDRVNIDDNLVGDTTNYGVGQLGGTFNNARRNIVRRQPDLWNGQRNTKSADGNVGFQFWDYNGVGAAGFNNNTADANNVAWQYRKVDNSLQRNDLFIPATGIVGANNTYTNGVQPAGNVTAADVYALYGLMRARVTAAGLTVGPV